MRHEKFDRTASANDKPAITAPQAASHLSLSSKHAIESTVTSNVSSKCILRPIPRLNPKPNPDLNPSVPQPSVTEGEAVDGLPVLFGGVQSVNATQNPAFASYNHAFVWYCSSDCHLGAGPGLVATDETVSTQR